MNRGSQAESLRDPADVTAFNEAPIHESGKCAAAMSRNSPGLAFNEAPIHESGKSGRPRSKRPPPCALQ